MADTTNYVWSYYLAPYKISDDASNRYIAKVRVGSTITIDDIATSITESRTDLRKDTILMVLNLLSDKVMEQVCMGNIVNAGFCVLRPVIPGTWKDRSGTLPDGSKPQVSISPTKAFRSELELVDVHYTKYTLEQGGACICSVTTNITNSTDGIIIPGRSITLKGRKIKCVSSDGTGFGTIEFINQETGESTAVTDISYNCGTRVVCVVPSSLASGSYTLVLTTYYVDSGKQLKSARVLEYYRTLQVE